MNCRTWPAADVQRPVQLPSPAEQVSRVAVTRHCMIGLTPVRRVQISIDPEVARVKKGAAGNDGTIHSLFNITAQK